MKIIKWLLLGLAALLVVTTIGGYWFLSYSKPQYHGDIVLKGLSAEVQVYYDTFGVPHIYAENQQDVYFALGFVHAQDRLFQMELLRRVGGGQLAEIFGPELAATDQFMRTIGINEVAKQSAEALLSTTTQGFQLAADSYLNGVNAFLHQGPTPPEFTLLGIPKRDFDKVDLYRILGYMGFSFNTAIRTDPLLTKIATSLDSTYLKDLVINTTVDNTAIPTFEQDSTSPQTISHTAISVLKSLPVPLWMGSNSWVVGPKKSRSGYPLLANDTHIGFGQPAVWYEAHLNSPGFDFYGNHLAGVPFALVGHSDFCAWGITIFPFDDMDFYRERQNPEDSNQVWNQDRWEPLEVRNELVKVKGGADLKFTVRSSRHGPIINEVNTTVDSLEHQPVSLFWTYLKFPNKALEITYDMEHSRSMDQFRQAISRLEAPGLNITYADRDGNIAWWAAGRLLRRPDHVESKMILDGASGLDDPLGWYPFSENPRAENPDWGFVYSANNQPDSAYGVLHPGYYYPGARGQRIIELLSEKDDWDLASFQKMVVDDKSPDYPGIAQKITSMLSIDLSPLEEEARDILNNWEGHHGLDDLGPSLYYKLTYYLQKNLFQDELGKTDFDTYITTMVARRTLGIILDNTESVWWDDRNTELAESPDDIVNRSFREAVSDLESQLGSDSRQWRWGKLHILEHQHAIGRQKPFNHLFNVGPFPCRGGDEVINKMDFDEGGHPYKVLSGPAMRILIDLADMKNSISVLPTGQAGHPLSPHYNDQAVLYNSGTFREQLMDREKIIQQSPNKLVLKPAASE